MHAILPTVSGIGQHAPSLVALVVALSLTACGSTSADPDDRAGGGGNASSGSAPDCAPPCEAKATECGANATQASQGCSMLCGGGATAGQLACLEGKSCAELGSASSLDELCPAGTGSTSSSGAGSSAASSSSGAGGGCPMAPAGMCVPYRDGSCSVYPDHFPMICAEGAADLQKCSFIAAGCNFYCCTI